MAKFQILTPTGPATIHLATRRKGGVLHWRYWDPARGNWRTGSTHTRIQRDAMTAARKDILEIISKRGKAGATWQLGQAVNECLRDRFPDAARMAEGPGLHDLPKRLPEDSEQWDTYRDARGRLLPFVDATGAAQAIGDADTFTGWCQSFLSSRRAKGVGPTGLSNDQRVLSRLAAWISSRRPPRVDWSDNNPAARKLLDLPPIPKRIPKIPAGSRVDAFLESIRDTDIYPAVVLILSGIRPAGASRVEWSAIDLKTGTVHIREKLEERTLRLGAWAKGELVDWRRQADRPEGPLWPFTRNYLFVRFRRLRDAAGLDGLTMQAIRRHVSQRLYAAGVPPQIEAKVMGHSVQTAMRNYVNIAALDERPDVEAALDFGQDKAMSRNRSKNRSKPAKKRSRKGKKRQGQ